MSRAVLQSQSAIAALSYRCKSTIDVEETDSAGMRDEMTNGRTERVEAYGQGYQMIVLYCKIA